MTCSFMKLSDALTLYFDLGLEADEVADAGADCTLGGKLWGWHMAIFWNEQGNITSIIITILHRG